MVRSCRAGSIWSGLCSEPIRSTLRTFRIALDRPDPTEFFFPSRHGDSWTVLLPEGRQLQDRRASISQPRSWRGRLCSARSCFDLPTARLLLRALAVLVLRPGPFAVMSSAVYSSILSSSGDSGWSRHSDLVPPPQYDSYCSSPDSGFSKPRSEMPNSFAIFDRGRAANFRLQGKFSETVSRSDGFITKMPFFDWDEAV